MRWHTISRATRQVFVHQSTTKRWATTLQVLTKRKGVSSHDCEHMRPQTSLGTTHRNTPTKEGFTEKMFHLCLVIRSNLSVLKKRTTHCFSIWQLRLPSFDEFRRFTKTYNFVTLAIKNATRLRVRGEPLAFSVHQLSPNVNPLDTTKRQCLCSSYNFPQSPEQCSPIKYARVSRCYHRDVVIWFCSSFTQSERLLQTDQLIIRHQVVFVTNFIRTLISNVFVNLFKSDATSGDGNPN